MEIKAIDVFPMTWRDRLGGLPTALQRGGFGIFIPGAGRFNDVLKRSGWCMQAIQKEVARLEVSEYFDFSLTIGTVLPVIKPRKPNFIYTDLTILANLYYPEGEERVKLWKECLDNEKQTLQSAALVFTMSNHVSQSLEDHYHIPKEKIIRVNAGYNISPVQNVDLGRFERERILFIGVDWELKGGPDLLKSFRRLRQYHPQATLTIVGCNPGISEPGVEIVGRVSQADVPKYLATSTVFCMPSKRDAFGIVYLEAMLAGLPVVGLKLGAVPDFIIDGENGYAIEPGNIQELTSRLEELITDPEKCRRMGEKGRQLVEAEYTWSRTQQKMWHSIKRIVGF